MNEVYASLLTTDKEPSWQSIGSVEFLRFKIQPKTQR